MTLNLVQHRSEPSIWDTAGHSAHDAERLLVGALGGALVASAVRRRSSSGWLLVVGGCSLVLWAAAQVDTRRYRRARLRALWMRTRSTDGDAVREASEQSFPASDAPSWT